jgi:uncharacterized repeat protein (TIGR03803 family)
MELSTHPSSVAPVLATIAAVVIFAGVAQARDGAYRVLYQFGQSTQDGWWPVGAPAVAKNGDLYGVTIAGGTYDWGTVFKLTAPRNPSGAWTETRLYDFPSQNQEFPTSLVIGKDGTLYGAGGGPNTRGFIFRLTPPVSRDGPWTYGVLYTLKSSADGSAIQGNLVFDDKGNLYGATELGGDLNCGMNDGCGTAFELIRPTTKGGKWHFKVLYTFKGKPDGVQPFAGLVFDQRGSLYGTTNYGGTFGYGVVYRLTPPKEKGHAWTETVLFSFDRSSNVGCDPGAPLIFDNLGKIYGTTGSGGDLNCQAGYGCGVAFQLAPPSKTGGTWIYTTLYAFQGGNDGINPEGYGVFDERGNLYGVTEEGGAAGGGTAYNLRPPRESAAGAWTETVLHRFSGSNGDGALPGGGLTWGKWHDLYGFTSEGGTCQGCGTAFELRP